MAKEGEVLAAPVGRTFWVDATVPQVDTDRLMIDIKDKFEKYYSIRLSNYMVQDAYVPKPHVIKAGLQVEPDHTIEEGA